MSKTKKSQDPEILPNKDYWHNMQIDPGVVLSLFTPDSISSRLAKFATSDLKTFFETNTGGSAKAISKDDLISLLERSYAGLLNTLLLLYQFSRFVSKRVLTELCTKKGLKSGKKTATELSLLLFNNAKEELRRARIASIGYKIKTKHAFQAKTNKIKKEITDEKTLQNIAAHIESRLSTPIKRAQLKEHYFDDVKETYRLFIKYEDKEQSIEEWDGEKWYKPIDWIVIDYNSENHYLTLRCRDESRVKHAVAIIAEATTGDESSFVQQTLDTWIDKFDVGEVEKLEQNGFKVIDHNIRMISIEESSLVNRPNLVIRGNKLQETMDDLKRQYKLDLLSGIVPVAFSIRISFEYEGVKDEISMDLRKGKSGYNFSKDTNEQVMKFLIDYISRLFSGA